MSTQDATSDGAWAGQGQNSGFVFVQNRSLTPLTSAGIPRVDGKSSIHLVPAIDPCTVIKAEKPKLDHHVTYVDYMYFADSDGRWRKKGMTGTTPTTRKPAPPLRPM